MNSEVKTDWKFIYGALIICIIILSLTILSITRSDVEIFALILILLSTCFCVFLVLYFTKTALLAADECEPQPESWIDYYHLYRFLEEHDIDSLRIFEKEVIENES